MRRLMVFTNLDGSLLDSVTYSWEPARPALDLLRALAVPIVLVSSKTRMELEQIRARQRSRALVMALILGGLVILFYAISIAKMAIAG